MIWRIQTMFRFLQVFAKILLEETSWHCLFSSSSRYGCLSWHRCFEESFEHLCCLWDEWAHWRWSSYRLLSFEGQFHPSNTSQICQWSAQMSLIATWPFLCTCWPTQCQHGMLQSPLSSNQLIMWGTFQYTCRSSWVKAQTSCTGIWFWTEEGRT